jgi:hypothetical protein
MPPVSKFKATVASVALVSLATLTLGLGEGVAQTRYTAALASVDQPKMPEW